MDENYSIIPHGVNFQDPIFSDTPENHRMFASLFQFSNCTPGTQVHTYTPDWEIQEDNRLWCSNVQKALFEEEEKVKNLSQKVKTLEKANNHLKDKVKNMKRLLRQAKRETKESVQSFKQLHESEPESRHPQQDTDQDQKPTLKKILPKKLKNWDMIHPWGTPVVIMVFRGSRITLIDHGNL